MMGQLQKAGVSVFFEDGSIRYRCGAQGPDQALLQQLSGRKDELAAYLRARDMADFPPLAPATRLVPSVIQEIWWNWIDRDASLTLSLIEFIKGSDPDEVAEAIRAIVSDHATLRSRFSEAGGILRVTHNGAETFQVEQEALVPSAGIEHLKACIDGFIALPLRAGADWLVRAKVITAPGYGQVAVLVANHMVVDGTSIDILRSDLRQKTGKAPARPRRNAFVYADFALWQQRYLDRAGGALERYWRLRMKGCPQICSPVGKLSLHWQPGRKVRRTFTIPDFAQSALVRFASQNATFPFLVYATLLGLTVMRWCGQGNFALRSICDARVLPQFAGMVGLMTGADTIQIDLDPADAFLHNLRRVEREYYASSKLRLPNIYAVPPFSAGPCLAAEDQRHNVGIVLNYRKAAAQMQSLAPAHEEAHWPPREGAPRHDHWPHAVSPVCLELTQVGPVATAAFLLHEDLIVPAEQDRLIGIFFDSFQEMLGPWNDGARAQVLVPAASSSVAVGAQTAS